MRPHSSYTRSQTFVLLSGFPNHCNGAEGTLNSGDFLQIRTRSSGKRGPGARPSTHPTLETNKHVLQTIFCTNDFLLI